MPARSDILCKVVDHYVASIFYSTMGYAGIYCANYMDHLFLQVSRQFSK